MNTLIFLKVTDHDHLLPQVILLVFHRQVEIELSGAAGKMGVRRVSMCFHRYLTDTERASWMRQLSKSSGADSFGVRVQ